MTLLAPATITCLPYVCISAGKYRGKFVIDFYCRGVKKRRVLIGIITIITKKNIYIRTQNKLSTRNKQTFLSFICVRLYFPAGMSKKKKKNLVNGKHTASYTCVPYLLKRNDFYLFIFVVYFFNFFFWCVCVCVFNSLVLCGCVCVCVYIHIYNYCFRQTKNNNTLIIIIIIIIKIRNVLPETIDMQQCRQ